MFENMILEEFNKAVEKIASLSVTTTNTMVETAQKLKPLSETPTITATANNINPTLWDTKPLQQEIKIPMNDEQFENVKRLVGLEHRHIWRRTITRVIFNEPATIVFWGDSEKTVSKCYDEEYDEKKGLLMCIAKAHGYTHSHIKAVLKRRGLKGSQDAELCLLYDIAEKHGFSESQITELVEQFTPKENEKTKN